LLCGFQPTRLASLPDIPVYLRLSGLCPSEHNIHFCTVTGLWERSHFFLSSIQWSCKGTKGSCALLKGRHSPHTATSRLLKNNDIENSTLRLQQLCSLCCYHVSNGCSSGQHRCKQCHGVETRMEAQMEGIGAQRTLMHRGHRCMDDRCVCCSLRHHPH
jgi:hypothetical protein